MQLCPSPFYLLAVTFFPFFFSSIVFSFFLQTHASNSNADGLLDDAKAQLEAQARIGRRNVDRIAELEEQTAEQTRTVCAIDGRDLWGRE